MTIGRAIIFQRNGRAGTSITLVIRVNTDGRVQGLHTEEVRRRGFHHRLHTLRYIDNVARYTDRISYHCHICKLGVSFSNQVLVGNRIIHISE